VKRRAEEHRAGAVVARVGGGLVLLLGTYWVMRPFLVPIAWAGILAYVTWPLYRWARQHTRRPRLAAAAFTLTVALGVGVPVAWILVALASEASHLIGLARGWLDDGAPLPSMFAEAVAARPWLAGRLAELQADLAIEPTEVLRYATRNAAALSAQLVNLAGGLATNVFKFTLTMVTLYVLYLDGERLAVQAGRLSRIVFPQASEGFLDHVGAVVRAVVFGLLGTAFVQGVIAGIGFAIFGVPSPVALGALTFAASFVPMGPALVWGGAALWLLANGHGSAAAGMGLYGLLLVSSIDNVLRPILIGGGPVRIPFLLVFFGVLGGLAAFGALGLFLGPVLLSVTFALVAQFGGRAGGEGETRPLSRTGSAG
jgi:predicted PurR-regulated permease PerM